jgi:hypothetical protein
MYKRIIIAILLTACGTDIVKPPTPTPTAELQAVLANNIVATRQYAPTCQYTPDFKGISKDTCRAEGTGEGDGDTMLWAGLLCLSGEALGCATAKASVSALGQPYRSPGRVDKETSNTFSRDMFLGLMAYLLATGDTEIAKRFQSWLYSNNNNLCLDSCDMRSTTWGLMGEVWLKIGLPLTREMQLGKIGDDTSQYAAVNYANPGYQQHLIAVTVWLRQNIGTQTIILNEALRSLANKNPSNPFFAYLGEGKSDKVLQLAIDACPATEPDSKSEWQWERTEDYKNKRIIWDCVMLGNLLQ